MNRPVEERLVTAVAEGMPIDWDAERAAAPQARAFIDQLRVLEAIAGVHRSTVAPAGPGPIELTDNAAEVTTAVHGLSWGAYELREEIGKGSYGVVYRAHDPSLKRDLAIKLLHPSIAEQDALAERIYREGQALGRIHHPNVVAVYAVGPYNGRLGLCMELVRGRTLREIVNTQGLMNAEEAALVAQFVCRALTAVHGAGLLHRDISARNVMRDDTGRIVLMDFGAGLDVTDAARGARAAGTPLYMAPELFSGAAATPRTDLYSVGVLLYYLVTRRFPVEGRSVAEVAAGHRNGSLRLVSEHRADLPERFVRVIAKAIAPEPADRYASAAALGHALSEVADARPATAPPATIAWRRPAAIGLGTLAAMVGLAFLGRLSSYTFNTALEVPAPFSATSWTESLQWGAKSVLAPLAMAAALAVAYSLVDGLVQWLRGSSIGDLLGRRVRWLRSLGQQLGLDSTAGAARLVALGAVVSFLWVRYVRFPALIDSYTTIGAATPAQLVALSSANADEQDAYRMTLSMLVWVVIGCWIAIFRRARARREPTPESMAFAALTTIAVPLFLLNMPYRVFLHADAERAIYGTLACHVLAEQSGSVLLLCPERGRRPFAVADADAKLRRTGESSNVFDALAASLR